MQVKGKVSGGRVTHIAAGLERRRGYRPVLPIDESGRVTIPEEYLALIGLSGGGEIRMIVCDGGFAIERAEPGERGGCERSSATHA